MDKFKAIKCWGCSMLLTAVIGAESLPMFCHKCHHVSMTHLPEQNYTVGTASIVAVAVSGISDTATTVILPSFDNPKT